MPQPQLQPPPLVETPPPGPKTAGISIAPHLDRQTRFQQVLHAEHWDDRARIINALADPDHTDHAPAARRMAACAQGASFFIDQATETVRPWLSRCGHRLCPFCSNARSAGTTENLLELMLQHHADRMMILTLRSHDLPLQLQVEQLLHSFKKLRNRAVWKRFVDGGIYVLEITKNPKTGLWHPHLHILYVGKFWPQKHLSATWRDITIDSNVVWVTQVHDIDGAAKELAKYIGKPQRIATLTPSQIREYATATKSVRMLQTFGTLHGKKPADSDKPDPAPRTDERVRLSTLLHLSRLGHEEAVILLTRLAEKYTVFGRYVYHEIPQLAPTPRHVDRTLELLAVLRGDRPPPRAGPTADPVDPDIDHKICQAFYAYRSAIAAGRFAETIWYYPTETEQIDGYIRR